LEAYEDTEIKVEAPYVPETIEEPIIGGPQVVVEK
jgi:hypothetical protein